MLLRSCFTLQCDEFTERSVCQQFRTRARESDDLFLKKRQISILLSQYCGLLTARTLNPLNIWPGLQFKNVYSRQNWSSDWLMLDVNLIRMSLTPLSMNGIQVLHRVFVQKVAILNKPCKVFCKFDHILCIICISKIMFYHWTDRFPTNSV